MPNAFLYIRVSTDEQAEKGYSLKYQEDTLRSYCLQHQFTIIQIFKEDCSAKSFKRPAWIGMMKELKAFSKRETAWLLFTKWDRFSRNTTEAYLVLRVLKQMRIVAQAIEQPIDHQVPESKLMLAMYLSMPEAENDRRGQEVKKGMRKAQEEGRWMGGAPIGYRNVCYLNGTKTIIPQEPECSIIADVFNRVASGVIPINKIFYEATELGLHCSRTHFYRLLHNPVYMGRVKVAADCEKDQKLAMGLHMGLVSEDIFKKVQQLSKKGEGSGNSIVGFNPRYPLKGYLCCPVCLKTLTASGSRGQQGAKYHYYHCVKANHPRFRIDQVHERFWDFVRELRPIAYYQTYFQELLTQLFERRSRELNVNQGKKSRKIDIFTQRIQSLRELMLDNGIGFKEYQRMKQDMEVKVDLLTRAIVSEQQKFRNYAANSEQVFYLFCHLDELYYRISDEAKPQFMLWMLTKGAIWNSGYLADLLNKAILIIYGLYYPAGSDPDSFIVKVAEAHCEFLIKFIDDEIIERECGSEK